MKRSRQTLLAMGMFLSLGASAYATSVDFTFDTTTINGTTITGLSSGANSLAIQTYMGAVLTASGVSGCGANGSGCVTVLVSGSSGAVADRTYNGDGHVTGPGSTTAPTSLTLGNSTGATASNTASTIGAADTFIANTNDSSGTVSQQITIQFHNITGLTITSFDYEIFPDGTCTSLTTGNCGASHSSTPSGFANQPDLEFAAGTNTSGTVGTVGSDDTIQNTFYGVTPGTTNGTATHSPNSGSGAELAPQLIGTWSGSLTGDTELDFVDWPATIGIDNLVISGTNIVHSNMSSPVPEPTTIALLGTLVFFLTKKLRKA